MEACACGVTHLSVGLGGVERPAIPSSSSSLSDTEDAKVTALSGSSPCSHDIMNLYCLWSKCLTWRSRSSSTSVGFLEPPLIPNNLNILEDGYTKPITTYARSSFIIL